jgi:hypothetical protein
MFIQFASVRGFRVEIIVVVFDIDNLSYGIAGEYLVIN